MNKQSFGFAALFWCCLVLVVTLFIYPTQSALAATDNTIDRSSYFDFGPYYGPKTQVLGISLSSLEQLPVPQVPESAAIPPGSGILPGNFLYPFEQLTENIQLTFTTDPIKKEELRLQFATERLSEAKTLVDQGQQTAAADALTNYRDTMRTVTDNMSELSNKNIPGTDVLATSVEEAASNHIIATRSLALSSSPVISQNWSVAVDASLESIDKTADIKKQPPVPDELSASIQELKKQGLLSPEESSKLYALESRNAVREELDKLASSGQFPISEIFKLDTAIATKYPENYRQTLNILQFSELKNYQTLPPPSPEITAKIKDWQEQSDKITPPEDIRPYLYYQRAESLVKNINLNDFTDSQKAEVVQNYPQAASQNSTYTPISPSPTPSPATDQTQPSPTPSESASPSPSPTPAPLSADPYLLSYTGPLPGNPAYLFKQFTERLRTTTTFDPARRLELQMGYAEERLQEVNALAKAGQNDSTYVNALKRYKDSIDEVSANVEAFVGSEQIKDGLAKKLETVAGRHNIIFEKGLLPPSKDDEKINGEVIKATENAMDIGADVLNQPAVPPQLATRLQDLKTQGLILPEEVDKLTKAESRGEVRDQIRELMEQGTFPPADAKKLDEVQIQTFPSDYNQLVEVRKVEELQLLRAAQTEFAQTATLRSTKDSYEQRIQTLTNTIDPTFIKPEDLGGREDLIKTYETLAAVPRPINGGQFGAEATPGAQLATTPPTRQDAALSACPEGAIFKTLGGCVWADSGKSLNDYDQYKCDGPRQYYSFAAKKCVAFDPTRGLNSNDAKPLCPVGYTWSWQTQICQVFTGGGPPIPSPSPQPEPINDKEREERAKHCPEGSSYQPPNGCTWDKSGKSISDTNQYRCSKGQYYSFGQGECVVSPKEGQPYPKDIKPVCEEETYFDWFTMQCITPRPIPAAQGQPGAIIANEFRTPFITPYSPFYFLKTAGEGVQRTFALTTEARETVSLSQAEERLVEAADAIKKNDESGFKKAVNAYTSTMQLLVADISKDGLAEGAKIKIGKKLSEEAVKQNLLLQKLSAWAPQTQETTINAAVSATILSVDKAADISGEPPIPQDIKEKIEALPEKMISEEDKKKLLELDSRVEARLKLGALVTNGGLTQTDTAFLTKDFDGVDQNAKSKVEELAKLEEITTTTKNKGELEEKIEKNEEIVSQLQEFEKTFEPGNEIPSEIRPYVRLTRINEVTQTIRPDIVKLEDFQNRKDVVLAVATLQQEFKPTKESYRQVEDFRRRNPGTALPPDLARIEALSYSLGVRGEAGPCFLPTPPFPDNTPCPAPGAAIPITTSYYLADDTGYRPGYFTPSSQVPASVDKDGKPLVYGQGPQAQSAGICPDGYHWMYDSGGWCMSNGGSYGSSYNFTPTGTGPGYTPYSPYYTAPGAPPVTYKYQDTNSNDGCNYGSDKDSSGNCILAEGYRFSTTYAPPSFYGTAPTYYTTTPPSGTVPGSGPKPTSPGQCPKGFHWMSDTGGWCMSDGPTYVPGGNTTSSAPPAGGYNCGSQPYDPVTKKCKDGACPGGFNWDGGKCVASSYSDNVYNNYYSPNLNQSSCGPGYYWDGKGCIRTSSTDTYGSCNPPSSGCGSNSYWDYGSCSCRGSSNYYGGPTSSGSSCSPPAGGCGSGWFDSGTCSCKQASSQGCYNVSASSCGSGFYWDSGACTCRSNSSSTSTGTTSTSTSSGGGTSSGSCPSGYHWMSESGGWCMSDGAQSSSTSTSTSTTSPSPTPSSTSTTTTTEPAPTSAPTTTTTTETSSPPPATTSEPAQAPTSSP